MFSGLCLCVLSVLWDLKGSVLKFLTGRFTIRSFSGTVAVHLFFSFELGILSWFVCLFLGLHLRHMEVPWLGVESEL